MKVKGLINCMLIVAAISGALVSCTYEELIPPKVEVPDSVKFSTNIIPIFDASCNISGCHNTGGRRPDLSEANAYTSLIFGGFVDIDAPESSTLYIKIIPGGSMNRYATEQDAALILEWIKQGALEN